MLCDKLLANFRKFDLLKMGMVDEDQAGSRLYRLIKSNLATC